MRPSGRAPDQLRSIVLEPGFSKHAEGSCFAKFGDTHVLCTASVEDKVPPFLRDSGGGWVTAEYSMLPGSTATRSSRGPNGRAKEIERLISRSLRGAVDLSALGPRTITIDCDVLQADGGTRTAAITGSFVALHQAFSHMKRLGALSSIPLRDHVAAISCGIYKGMPVLDLDYDEDSSADADANFVLTGSGKIVELQGTAEKTPFDESEFQTLLGLAKQGIADLVKKQKAALGI